jgi:hypothetical protein
MAAPLICLWLRVRSRWMMEEQDLYHCFRCPEAAQSLLVSTFCALNSYEAFLPKNGRAIGQLIG